eukprot:TRINITY_DN3650_c0_g1_i1.p1 TRINITY_DN3650_c0_g1~~TRINITY_DN3650_c0_g1_i1.p1  ORF type:complete len:112 (-),score=21.69 TRINITY_DN3650_c0_g1_i1:534-869(-)
MEMYDTECYTIEVYPNRALGESDKLYILEEGFELKENHDLDDIHYVAEIPEGQKITIMHFDGESNRRKPLLQRRIFSPNDNQRFAVNLDGSNPVGNNSRLVHLDLRKALQR